jgi:hypothetical protein
MAGSGVAGVTGGTAVVDLRIKTLEESVVKLEAALEELKKENKLDVHNVTCTISHVHGMAYPGCQIVVP